MVYEADIIKEYPCDGMTGRQVIYTNEREITVGNVIDVIAKASGCHRINAMQETYLYEYYKGKQDILYKTKEVRESINNKVCENKANEIVTFKTAFLLSDPIQYVSTTAEDEKVKKLDLLNTFFDDADKQGADKSTADWIHICGVAPRLVVRRDDWDEDYSESPFSIYSLDPREAFCIYHSGLGHKRLAGVFIQYDEKGREYHCVYTKSFYCEVQNGEFKRRPEPHIYNCVPMVEYINNKARMGSFESVLPLLNAVNRMQSDRTDAIQDYVNAYDVFQNCDIDVEQYKSLSAGGSYIKIASMTPGIEAKVYRISSQLDQNGVETAKKDIEMSILSICGMPSLGDGNSNTSDNVGSVIYRQGYFSAGARANDTANLWKETEKEFIRIILKECPNQFENFKLSDIRIEWTRKSLENLQSKVQVLCEMLNNSKIHPKDAFETSGVFVDSERAYKRGLEWYEEEQAKLEAEMDNADDDGAAETGDQA